MTDEVEQLGVDTIRALSMDAVQRAESGHPGTPMALAPLGWAVFTRHLRHNPADPEWADRDRFVLSCGHASMLLYSLLHLTGYDLPLDELKRFRQLGSATPGHPEHFLTTGVETTTGPLGQGFGNAVGMALAEAMLAARYNRPGHEVVDHRTWVFASDGDMMEGVASEAASLAGHLGLGKLAVFYDDNHITIDGSTELSFDTEDTEARFAAYGWRTLSVDDVNDLSLLDKVLQTVADGDGRPTFVRVRSVIGYPAPNAANTAAAHGSPLGPEEVVSAKRVMAWDYPDFHVPEEVRAHADQHDRGARAQAAWRDRFEAYREEHPKLADEFERVMAGQLPDDWEPEWPVFSPGESLATRKSSGAVINALAATVPELVGGSADLASSNSTTITDAGEVSRGDYAGRNINFGVREHAMAALCNGMVLHRGLRPFAGTFLIFSDYLRPSLRLAALMGVPVIYVLTHDSVGLGEDGPTHQPVEHLAALRAIPGLVVLRPADATESAGAWRHAIARTDGPTVLALTRQNVPVLAETSAEQVAHGAYVVADSDDAEIVIVATGSEVQLAVEAVELLAHRGIAARAVSMPSQELFAAAAEEYQDEVLPGDLPVLSVEAAVSFGWDRWADAFVSLDRFGASAPAADVFDAFGFTAVNVADAAEELLNGSEG